VALHHYPARFLSKQFCPLTAVHVANVLEHEIHKESNPLPLSTVDASYLAELQVADRLDAWRDLCQEKLL
jgi:hypothetical protein